MIVWQPTLSGEKEDNHVVLKKKLTIRQDVSIAIPSTIPATTSGSIQLGPSSFEVPKPLDLMDAITTTLPIDQGHIEPISIGDHSEIFFAIRIPSDKRIFILEDLSKEVFIGF